MLNAKSKYLQIAFNRSLDEVKSMVYKLPASDKIIIEAGTPLIRKYGQKGITSLKNWWSERIQKPAYIIADLKCMNRSTQEVLSLIHILNLNNPIFLFYYYRMFF